MELLKKEKLKNSIKYSLIIIMGIFFILFGLFKIFYKHKLITTNQQLNDSQIEEFFDNDNIQEETDTLILEETDDKKVEEVNYIGILEIPKINLYRGIVDKNSYSNNVNRNIYTVKETILPDEQDTSHIILASHSGNSYVSYFRYLNKLEMDDIVYFYYQGIKYTYQISNRYEVDKTGTVELSQTEVSDITLITCIDNTNKQVVFVGKLINQENY